MSEEEYGPALPPGLLKKKDENKEKVPGPQLQAQQTTQFRDDSQQNVLPQTDMGSIGPTLPPHLIKDSPKKRSVIGPAMPPGINISDNDSSEEESIGPTLPPQLKGDNSRNEMKNIGPQFHHHRTNNRANILGPSLPPDFKSKGDYSSSDDDNDVIGPMPHEMLKGDNSQSTVAEIELRARQMKDKLEGKEQKEDKIARESWMTELPSSKLSKNIGLQARSFRAKAGPDMSDRSAWTDTPSDKEKKSKEDGKSKKRTHDGVVQSSRDKQLKKDVKKYNESNRPESLLDMHQKEIQKKQKKIEDKPAERRPFDRELDLQVNKFDDAQRKAIIKKSQKLDSRFSHGGSQFL